jgi:hypothetical protein
MSNKSDLQTILDEVGNYQDTVNALVAFVALLTHDGNSVRENARFGFGRRMTTSAGNKFAPEDEITPDATIQRSSTFGVTAEMKKTLSKDESTWKTCADQVGKYCDDLTGWWTTSERIKKSNAVLLIHHSRARRYVRFLEKHVAADRRFDAAPSCVIEFHRSDENASFIAFRLEYGEIADRELAQQLADSVSVPLEKVLKSFSGIKYYDAPPPVETILSHLWGQFFPPLANEVAFDESKRCRPISVSVEAITKEMQRAFGSGRLHADTRSIEFPTKQWIREAFARLVRYKLAAASDDPDVYTVFYRTPREDLKSYFAKLSTKASRKSTQIADGQKDLFESSG